MKLLLKIPYDGYVYFSWWELWNDKGRVNYSTFRQRLRRYPDQVDYALGRAKRRELIPN